MPIPVLRPRSAFSMNKDGEQKNSEPKKGRKRFLRLRGKQLIIPIICILLLLGGIMSVGAFAYFSRDLPDPQKLSDRSVAESTRIYARDGSTLLYEIHGDIRRTIVPLDEIPGHVKEATIAIEDKDFYSHKGFSLRGIFRAIITDVIQGSRAQGGSTITQQLIKNAILTNEKKITRKVKELVLAYQIERKFSKDQILQLYFNEIPYGSNVYGIESAAQYYFNKPSKNLAVEEGALLAALTQRPTYFSPYGSNKEKLVARQQYVISLMEEQGYLTADEAKAAKEVDILSKVATAKESIKAPHFVFYVREYLADKYGEAVVERGGLQVITTLDPKLQADAESAVAEFGETNQKKYGAGNASLVAINPKNGQVLAMVGSRDYFDKANDGNVNVSLRVRNPGSSFKPFIYATAFTKGYTPDTVIFDLKTNFGPQGDGTNYIPNNYDGGERGPIKMRNALAGSLNIPAVKTLYLAGIPKVVELAQAAGYTTVQSADQYGLALALGGAGVRLLDHTSAFGIFAQEGKHYTPQSIVKILDHKDKVLEEFKPQEQQVLDKNVANMMASVLSDNDARSFVFGSRSKLILPGRAVGAKTGTTNDWRDGWTMGFTPSLVAGVWVGNNDNSVMAKGADGSFVAAPIWNAFMQKALAGTPAEKFPGFKAPKTDKAILKGDFDAGSSVAIDSITKLAIPASCLSDYPKAFVDTEQIKEVHDILYYVNKDDPAGAALKNPEADPQFKRWEEPVQAWAKKKGYKSDKPKEGPCDLRAEKNMPVAQIIAPTTAETVATQTPTLSLQVTGPQPITLVSITVDDIAVGQFTGGTLSGAIDLSAFGNGFHTLKVVVTDSVKNTGTASTDINLLIPTP